MRTWQDEPGAREWRAAADAADRLRGLKVPVSELPGYVQGWAVFAEALQLLATPEVPGNLTAGPRRCPRRFAHHSGPDGRPHVCGRRTRSVNSADRLSAKSAAAAWLRGSGTRADIDFVQSDGSPLGRLEY
ncbi:hypothetical protein [Streptomyces anulatus]|uniref:hypothetical protein n=1 Tax=Streptomyces anulatus TaxID=1892 RepID=UPI00342D0302